MNKVIKFQEGGLLASITPNTLGRFEGIAPVRQQNVAIPNPLDVGSVFNMTQSIQGQRRLDQLDRDYLERVRQFDKDLEFRNRQQEFEQQEVFFNDINSLFLQDQAQRQHRKTTTSSGGMNDIISDIDPVLYADDIGRIADKFNAALESGVSLASSVGNDPQKTLQARMELQKIRGNLMRDIRNDTRFQDISRTERMYNDMNNLIEDIITKDPNQKLILSEWENLQRKRQEHAKGIRKLSPIDFRADSMVFNQGKVRTSLDKVVPEAILKNTEGVILTEEDRADLKGFIAKGTRITQETEDNAVRLAKETLMRDHDFLGFASNIASRDEIGLDEAVDQIIRTEVQRLRHDQDSRLLDITIQNLPSASTKSSTSTSLRNQPALIPNPKDGLERGTNDRADGIYASGYNVMSGYNSTYTTDPKNIVKDIERVVGNKGEAGLHREIDPNTNELIFYEIADNDDTADVFPIKKGNQYVREIGRFKLMTTESDTGEVVPLSRKGKSDIIQSINNNMDFKPTEQAIKSPPTTVGDSIAAIESHGGVYDLLHGEDTPGVPSGKGRSTALGKYQFIWSIHGEDIKRITRLEPKAITNEDRDRFNSSALKLNKEGKYVSMFNAYSDEEKGYIKAFLESPEAQEKYFDYINTTQYNPAVSSLKSKYPDLDDKLLRYMVHHMGTERSVDDYLKTGRYVTKDGDLTDSTEDALGKFGNVNNINVKEQLTKHFEDENIPTITIPNSKLDIEPVDDGLSDFEREFIDQEGGDVESMLDYVIDNKIRLPKDIDIEVDGELVGLDKARKRIGSKRRDLASKQKSLEAARANLERENIRREKRGESITSEEDHNFIQQTKSSIENLQEELSTIESNVHRHAYNAIIDSVMPVEALNAYTYLADVIERHLEVDEPGDDPLLLADLPGVEISKSAAARDGYKINNKGDITIAANKEELIDWISENLRGSAFASVGVENMFADRRTRLNKAIEAQRTTTGTSTDTNTGVVSKYYND